MLRALAISAFVASNIVACGPDAGSSEPSLAVPNVLAEQLAPSGEAPPSFADFDARIEQRLATDSRVRGAVAVVVHAAHGIVHQRAYGTFALDRSFMLGTSSVLLSAGVLLRLVDQGALRLDDPIGELLPQWGKHKQQLSVAQLLSGSAGMPSLEAVRNHGFGIVDEPVPALAAHLCQRRSESSLAACGRAIYEDDAVETNGAPDTRFAFGGSQLQLAGALAEQVSGHSWDELLEQTYRAPCGVRSLGYTNPNPGQRAEEPFAYPSGFSGSSAGLSPTDNPSIDSGAYITGPDFARVLLMHLRGGRCGDTQVLHEATVARMQENRIGRVYEGVTGSPAASGYGLGWFVNEQTGTVSAPGSHGAYPLIDLKRGYAVLILLEEEYIMGMQFLLDVKPALDAMFPAR